jgi:signal transduction histidine kinase
MAVRRGETGKEVGRLGALVRDERKTLLDAWRTRVRELPSAANLDTPTLNDHIPGLIEELASALRSGSEQTIAESLAEGTPPAHGVQRYEDGFDIEEVVAEYNILRACVHDLADDNGLRLQGEPFHVLNRVLDGAIGAAVQAYAAHRAREVQQRREEYLAFVAHDLRTPLNAVALAVNFLEKAPPERGTRLESAALWKILRRNVSQLESMVSRIVRENVSFEAEAGLRIEQRPIDLWALVEAVCLDMAPVAEAGKVRVLNSVPEDLRIFADANMCRRVFQNLLSNAISYSQDGQVEVLALPSPDGGRVQCLVRDDGAGIPADRIDAVFEKLESDPGNPGGSGLGLGLAIVKAFVEAHGGQVQVESSEGEGACFQFSFPAVGE